MFITFIQLVFLILIIRQIGLVLVAWWTGTQSDVPFQSTHKSALKKLLEKLQIKSGQKIVDLGSGTGRVAFFFANQTPASVVGVEKNWPLFFLATSRQLLKPALKLTFKHQDIAQTDLSSVDIVYTYFSPRAYQKFQKKFERELKLGTTLLAWRYPFHSQQFRLITQFNNQHTMYIYRKQS